MFKDQNKHFMKIFGVAYFMILSISTLYSIKCFGDQQIMNWKGSEMRQLWPNRDTILQFTFSEDSQYSRLFMVIAWNFGGTEENHNKLQSGQSVSQLILGTSLEESETPHFQKENYIGTSKLQNSQRTQLSTKCSASLTRFLNQFALGSSTCTTSHSAFWHLHVTLTFYRCLREKFL